VGSRFDTDVEACVYFVYLQAIQDVVRHAGDAPTAVRLRMQDGRLGFEVIDLRTRGRRCSHRRGEGDPDLGDRIEALEGELSVESSPGASTEVRGRVPARIMEPAR